MKKINVVNMNNLAYKAIGLYQENENNPIYFQTRFGIQTFFLNHDTLCLVLEPVKTKKRIYTVRYVKQVEPYRFFFWNPKYKDVIEIPILKNMRNDYSVGDKIELTFL